MKIFQTYEQERGKHQLDKTLFWEYHFDRMDFQNQRRLVAERVIQLGRLSDFYAAFDLYGGIRGFRRIAKNEVVGIDDRSFDFMCKAFNLKKDETECYKRKVLRQRFLNSQKNFSPSLCMLFGQDIGYVIQPKTQK
ncbi:MAG: hypothetical protein IJ205_05125 [Bacteroidales bacterium]|nr:hypothetical protein [Bacteroidales bacterium]